MLRGSKFIVLLRHGRSMANHEGILQGQQDYPLHPVGIEQATRVATYWSKNPLPFERVITSPLKRAKRTAGVVSSALSIPIDKDPLWMERTFGNGEGMAYTQIKERIDQHREELVDVAELFEGSETDRDIRQRAALAIKSLLKMEAANILVVSHGGILNASMRYLLKIPLPTKGAQRVGFHFDNTGFTKVAYNQSDDHWSILSHNERPHLEDGL